MSSSLRLYPSDLSNQEWEILAPLIPSANSGGRPRKWPMHKILNAIFYPEPEPFDLDPRITGL